MSPAEEISRRRTFAIISHPDAGKTTLTEKLLLYGGALQLAGSVTARKNQRSTASDWMEMEKKRGISVSSTVLQFAYDGCVINLLDTPGHKDFSEDTYRVLTAVDAAIMVIDGARGIESQTRKLFEVCRRRGVPIFTFINKMDRPSRSALGTVDGRIGKCPRDRCLRGELAFGQQGQISAACMTVETKRCIFFNGQFRAPIVRQKESEVWMMNLSGRTWMKSRWPNPCRRSPSWMVQDMPSTES